MDCRGKRLFFRPVIHEGISTDLMIQTQTAMEEWAIGNVRAALETGKLKSPVPEQADL